MYSMWQQERWVGQMLSLLHGNNFFCFLFAFIGIQVSRVCCCWYGDQGGRGSALKAAGQIRAEMVTRAFLGLLQERWPASM
jgi:hypothetical protein